MPRALSVALTAAAVAALVAVGLVAVAPAPGHTQESSRVGCESAVPSSIGCRGRLVETRQVAPTAGGGGAAGLAEAPPQMRWQSHPVIVPHPELGLCLATDYRLVAESTPPSSWETDPGPRGFFMPCPSVAAEATARGRVETVVREWWTQADLPSPDPYIAPGRAITGLGAYLETRGRTSFVHTLDTEHGQVVVEATGTYLVDWGDGHTSGPHHAEGRPWPDGDIVHVYTDVGNYDVVVTERWTATWRIAAMAGRLDGLSTVARIDAFPVGQIQAVVVG